MRFRSLLLVLACIFSGLVGGWFSHFLPLAKSIGPIRTTRLELVDVSGKTRAFIGTDAMIMTGRDGKERLSMRLSYVDERPMILLSDHEQVRAHLGFFTNDAPSPKDEDWGLQFYKSHGYFEILSGVGIRRDWNDDKMEGYLFAEGKDGRKWREPSR